MARNRARLLQAAREVFAARGLEATLDDIAHHARLGTGTAYRHFRSRQEIIDAIFSDAAESFITDAEHALTIEDPWTALVTFLETSAQRQAGDRGLHQMFMGRRGTGVAEEEWGRLTSVITVLLDRAKGVGVLRADVELVDVVTLFAMLGAAYDLSAATSTELWRRQLALFLSGLRTVDQQEPLAPGTAVSTTALGAAIGVRPAPGAGP